MEKLPKKTVEIYKDIYPEVKSQQADILTVIQNEKEKHEQSAKIGISNTASDIAVTGGLTGELAFRAWEDYGIPLEISKEIAIAVVVFSLPDISI